MGCNKRDAGLQFPVRSRLITSPKPDQPRAAVADTEAARLGDAEDGIGSYASRLFSIWSRCDDRNAQGLKQILADIVYRIKNARISACHADFFLDVSEPLAHTVVTDWVGPESSNRLAAISPVRIRQSGAATEPLTCLFDKIDLHSLVS